MRCFWDTLYNTRFCASLVIFNQDSAAMPFPQTQLRNPSMLCSSRVILFSKMGRHRKFFNIFQRFLKREEAYLKNVVKISINFYAITTKQARTTVLTNNLCYSVFTTCLTKKKSSFTALIFRSVSIDSSLQPLGFLVHISVSCIKMELNSSSKAKTRCKILKRKFEVNDPY